MGIIDHGTHPYADFYPVEMVKRNLLQYGILIIVPLTLLILHLAGFIQGELGALLGWPTAFLIWQSSGPATRPHRYWWLVAALLLLLNWWIPVRTLVFLGGFALFLHIFEQSGRRPKLLLGVLGIAMSPVFFVASQVFTFPIRLQLTQWAGHILQWIQPDTQIEGNILVHQGQQFAVEPACEGISMLQTAAILLIFLLTVIPFRLEKRIALWPSILLLSIGMFLSLLANLCRIVLLVLFRIAPETLGHDLTGLATLLFYMVLPMAFLVRWYTRRHGKPAVSMPEFVPATGRQLLVSGVLFVVFLMAILRFHQPVSASSDRPLREKLTAFEYVTTQKDVDQYTAPGVLIYIKPIPAFYSSEHNPALCWSGSGYTLSAVRLDTLAGTAVYTGKLQGPKGTLYTAWWYDNGVTQTVSQWDWRSRQWRGAPAFSIVNVSVMEEGNLENQIQKIVSR